MSDLKKVQEALCQFVIGAATEKTPGLNISKAQLIPEVTRVLIELAKFNQLRPCETTVNVGYEGEPSQENIENIEKAIEIAMKNSLSSPK